MQVARNRTSPRNRTCPACGHVHYDRRFLEPGRKYFRCPQCHHVDYPDPADRDAALERAESPKKSWIERVWGE